MDKFSYGIEFYKNELFDLENVNLFKRKVKEATEIEKFFSNIILNKDAIRMYILRSYKMNKTFGKINRIKYIKGLIYADNIIDFNDIKEFANLLENKVFLQSKNSVWRNKGYIEDSSNNDFLEGEFDNCKLNVIELFDSYYDYYNSYDMNDTNFSEFDSDDDNEEKAISQMLDSSNEDYNDEFEDMSENLIPISVIEKINIFKENKEKIINDIIIKKHIDNEDKKIVRKGIEDWFNFSIESIQDLYSIRINSLILKDENLSNYL